MSLLWQRNLSCSRWYVDFDSFLWLKLSRQDEESYYKNATSHIAVISTAVLLRGILIFCHILSLKYLDAKMYNPGV